VLICAGGVVLGAQTATKPVTNQTLSIAVVVDTHPQQASVIDFERQVVESLRNVLADSEADGFVVSYSDHIAQVSDWSPIASGLKDAEGGIALDGGPASKQGAVLNDGVMAGLLKLGASTPEHRKALIVIGEGNDGGSAARFSHVLTAAKDQHVQCFALLVADHRAWVGRVRQYGFDLYRLSSGTRGKLYDVRTNPTSLDKALRDITRRLGSSDQRRSARHRPDVLNGGPANAPLTAYAGTGAGCPLRRIPHE